MYNEALSVTIFNLIVFLRGYRYCHLDNNDKLPFETLVLNTFIFLSYAIGANCWVNPEAFNLNDQDKNSRVVLSYGMEPSFLFSYVQFGSGAEFCVCREIYKVSGPHFRVCE